MTTRLTSLLLLFLVAGLVLAGPSAAAVNLRFTPSDTIVGPGQPGRLAIHIDDLDANVRTVDVYVTYDTTVVASVAGQPGQAFIDSGFFPFKGFENDTPGQWHGYCVILGSTDWLTGPGELYTWDFQGLVDGTSPVIAVEAYVADNEGTYYENVVLDPTSIIVHDPLSGADDTPAVRTGLSAWPNPFNPRTRIRCELPAAGPLELTVFDLRGRRVTTLHDGWADAGSRTFAWDGRDAGGRPQPAGPYFVRLVTNAVTRTTKVTLVK